MFKAYKYRIYPNQEQQEAFEKHFNACRFIYNLALETKEYAYKSQGVSLSAFDLGKQLSPLKKENEWLKEVNSQSLENAIHNLQSAYISFFKGIGDYPKYKKKNSKKSFCARDLGIVDFQTNLLSIPKIKNIPIVLHRKFEGETRSITISKTPAGKYYASILVDTGVTVKQKAFPEDDTKVIGIDVGLRHFAILSNGEKVENPAFLRIEMDRIKVLQRRASKKKKGSKNQRKANRKVAVLHEKVANRRKDFLHNLSDSIAKNYDVICVEGLGITDMLQCGYRSLALAIQDSSWGMFITMLDYKARWQGKQLIKIGQYIPSSKICSCCGYIKEELKAMEVRRWDCPSCGTNHDVDINAAVNIKSIALYNSGECIPGEPVELRTLVRA